MDQARYEAGLEVRRRVIGDEYVERALANTTDFDADWQRVLTEFCWGTVWTGAALTDKQRSLNNLCLLAALNKRDEFKLHFRGALRNGCSHEELRETLIQIAVYAGVPAGVEAFRLAREVLDQERSTADT
jgi:4-carboxymuconolactone decarboxylase